MPPRASGARVGPGWRALVAAVTFASGCAGASPPAKAHAVGIQGFQYRPAALTVAVGDTLVWTNEDVVPHTATSADGRWDSGSIAAKESGRVVIEREGTHRYVCAFHPGMKAEVVAR